jgi:hypothetical protein
VVVGFYLGSGPDAGPALCSATTATALQIGQCETVSCTWASPPTTGGSAVDVTVIANDGNGIPTCANNNRGLVEHVFCGQAQ